MDTILRIAIFFFLSLYIVYIILSSLNQHRKFDSHLLKNGSSNFSFPLTTLVTTFYLFPKSKHDPDDYKQWATNMFAYIDNPVVIFTSVKEFRVLNEIRNNFTDRRSKTIFILNYSSPLMMPPIRKHAKLFLHQNSMDPEGSLNTIQLYAIWCAKSYMLNLTSSLNPFQSTYFLYVDAGSFRSTKYRFKKWPDPQRISKAFDNNDRLLLGLVNPPPNNSCNLTYTQISMIVYTFIEGGIIGGRLSAIRWWTHVFYDLLDKFITSGKFIGKDQNLMAFIAFSNPTKINVILLYKLSCDDIWFGYGPLFASDDERLRLFGSRCQANDISDAVKPLDLVCSEANKSIVR